ncbi:MAG: RluA family pseudouridine synthase [Allosphingosinicella sp.]
MLVGKQLDAVVERADRAQQIVAQARAEQAGEFVGFHAERDDPCGERFRFFGRERSDLQGALCLEDFGADTISAPVGASQIIEARVAEDAAGWRLDRALAAAVPTMSRERLKALISSGAVADPQGQPVRDPAAKAVPGGVYAVAVPEPRPAHNEAQEIPLEIVFEDDHLLVVDKPAGLVVHPAAGNTDGTLVNALLHHCAGRLSGIGGVARPGIVHRIDKDTSGLLVVAKTDRAHEGLAAQFARHSIHRLYSAVVAGLPRPPSGTVDAPLARSSVNRKKMAIVEEGRGKRAVTHYRLVEPLRGASLVECRLETGRTHQVRVHMASIGHPLLGDPVYGRPRPEHKDVLKRLNFNRQALHAAELGFVHPVLNENLSFKSALPSDIQELLRVLTV